MTQAKKVFKNQDLVLKVSPNVDPEKFDINKYEAFLDALCREREYQKEAIRVTLRYLLGGQYSNLKELTEENYHQNPVLQEKYSSLDDFYDYLQLPDKLSCTLDMATATGKSYVLYGIARIMHLLPDSAKISNPRIINATQTITKGDICIENIHATYERTKSAIEDSLVGKGGRTLVLNDEVHHMANPPARDVAIKKWKEFLLDPKYNFRYIVGDFFKINTSDIKRSSLGIGALRRDGSIFYDNYSVSNSDEEDRKLLKELLDDETLPRYALPRVENAFNFKMEYSWQKGTHPKQGSFNPDFFIKIGKLR